MRRISLLQVSCAVVPPQRARLHPVCPCTTDIFQWRQTTALWRASPSLGVWTSSHEGRQKPRSAQSPGWVCGLWDPWSDPDRLSAALRPVLFSRRCLDALLVAGRRGPAETEWDILQSLAVSHGSHEAVSCLMLCSRCGVGRGTLISCDLRWCNGRTHFQTAKLTARVTRIINSGTKIFAEISTNTRTWES